MDSPEVATLRVFRDRLRNAPALLAAYVERNRQIIAAGVTDTVDYAYRKGEFVSDALSPENRSELCDSPRIRYNPASVGCLNFPRKGVKTVLVLNEYELRVVGALAEKQIATPDYYPMTLNALTNACNQKNHRDPVTSFDDATVARALDSLREKNLAYVFHGSDARVPKYGHLFSKVYELNPQETAVLLVLMLRGPQTPGELRSRTPHLMIFDGLSQVEETLQNLATRDEALVVKLPRVLGTKEARYAHLLGGPINVEEMAAAQPEHAAARTRGENERVAKLEAEVATLRQELSDLKTQFAEFRKQFE